MLAQQPDESPVLPYPEDPVFPTYPDSAPADRHKLPAAVVLGAVGLVVFAMIATALAVWSVRRDQSGSSASARHVAQLGIERSDEDQIRAVITTLEAALNDADYDSVRDVTCARMHTEADEALLRILRAMGRIDFTVIDVDVTGDVALVKLRVISGDYAPQDPTTMNFVQEGGRWKSCV